MYGHSVFEEDDEELPAGRRDQEILPWPACAGVYIARVSKDVIKIGSSESIEARLKQARSFVPFPIALLAFDEYTVDVRGHFRARITYQETLLHDRHADDWVDIPGTRELFRLSPRVRETVDTLRVQGGWDPWLPEEARPALSRVRLAPHELTKKQHERLQTLDRHERKYGSYILNARVTRHLGMTIAREHFIARSERPEVYEYMKNDGPLGTPPADESPDADFLLENV